MEFVGLSVFIKFFTAMFAVVNPIGASPIFIALMSGETTEFRKKSIVTASLTVFLILSFFSLLGNQILEVFGISIAGFKTAGGLILLLMSISMLQARQSRMKATEGERVEAEEKDNPAIFPFAIPILAGPGALATVVITTHNTPGLINLVAINGCIALLALITAVSLAFSTVMADKLGKTGLNVITRLMGILLASLAVEMIASGLIELFPALAKAS